MMKIKHALISAALVSSLAIGTSAALAQDETTPSGDPAGLVIGQPHNHRPGVPPNQALADGEVPELPQGQLPGAQFGQPPGRMPRQPWYPTQGDVTTESGTTPLVDWFQEDDFLELVEQYTGLTLSELREAAQDGETAADLIETNGQTVDAFMAAVMAQVNTYLDEAAAEDRLTSDQAANIEAQAQAHLTVWVRSDLIGMILAGL
jgi:hypothetical protein